MEVFLCLCSGAVAWVCAYAMLGDVAGSPRDSVRRLTQAVGRGLLVPLSRTDLVVWLLRRDEWRCVCHGVASRTRSLWDRPPSLAEASALLLLVLASLPALGLITSRSVIGGVVLGLAGVAWVVAWGARSSKRRQRELADEMPGVFRTLSVALGSGQTLAQAISYLGAHEKGPAARGFRMASLRLRCGASAEEALDRLAEEVPAPGMDLLVTALTISQRTGSPLKDLFQHAARLVERQRELDRELSVKTAQVRMSARVVCLLPLLLVAILSLISPDFQEGIATPTGLACVAVAALMDASALAIMRRLMKGVA